MILYHASPVLFKQLRFTKPRDEGHPNGALGVWTDMQNAEYLRGFGKYVYEITLHPHARVGDMPLYQLRNWSSSMHGCEFYEDQRAAYVRCGVDVLRILETKPSQFVILSLDAVEKCILVETN